MWLKAAWTDLHNFFWRTTSGQSWLFSAMHNFPPRLRYVTRLPQNTLATEKAHCFPRVHWLWKDRGWRDHPTIDKFQYYLKFQVLTDVSDAPSWLNIEASNEITFSAIPAVHGLRPPGRLSTKSVSWCFISIVSRHFTCSNSYLENFSVTFMQYILQAVKKLIRIRCSLLNGKFTDTATSCENVISVVM